MFGKRVERSARLDAGHAGQRVEPVDDETAAHVELVHHRLHRVPRALERGDPCELGAGAARVELMKRRVSGSTSGSGTAAYPSRQPVIANVFEKPSRRIVALAHRLVARERAVRAVVDHLRVDLVGEDPAVVAGEQPASSSITSAGTTPPVGFAGEFRITSFVRGVSRAGDVVGGEREAALLGERQRHRRRARPPDHRLVDREARVRVDDLVAGVAGREHAEEEERLRAGVTRTFAGWTAIPRERPRYAAAASRSCGMPGAGQ